MSKPSASYWAERFNLLEQNLHDQGAAYFNRVGRSYDAAIRDLEKELAGWYSRYATENGITYAEAKKQLSKGELAAFKMDVEEYIEKGRSLDPQWREQLEKASVRVHVSRLEAMKIRMQQNAELLAGETRDALDDMAHKVYSEKYYHTLYEIQKGVGVGFDCAELSEKKIKAAIGKTWAADGKHFSDRIWNDKAKLINELDTAFTQGVIRGTAPKKVIAEISKRMSVKKSNVARLILTENKALQSQAELDGYKELGVNVYEIVATLDSRTSPVCREMDGKQFKRSEFEPGITAPPFHPYCRTCTVPYDEDVNEIFKEGEERAARGDDGKYYRVPSGMTYKDWKKVYVDKKIKPESWLKTYRKNLKISILTSKIGEAETALNAAQANLDSIPNKTYSGIWKDDVTLEDWEAKKASIQAKKDYFDEQINNVTSTDDKVKFLTLTLELDEFAEEGEKYFKAKQAVKKAAEKVDDLKEELELVKKGKKKVDDPYSQKRKDAAVWCKKPKDADKVLREKCGEVWRNATDAQKRAIYDYTSGSGKFNRPLAGYRKPYYDIGSGWEEKFYVGPDKVWIDYEGAGDEIREMTNLIAKSTYDIDVWLQRGCSNNAMDAFFGFKHGTFGSLRGDDLQKLVGESGRLTNFISCGSSKGQGFTGEVILNVYCPKGTQMMYAEPFSAFSGSYHKLNWDGVVEATSYGHELETIIQRGAAYKVTKIERSGYTTYIDVEVHPERGYDLFQQNADEWKGSTENFKS